MLTVICGSCGKPSCLSSEMEKVLPYVDAIVCSECGHREKDLDDLVNYSKATGDIHHG